MKLLSGMPKGSPTPSLEHCIALWIFSHHPLNFKKKKSNFFNLSSNVLLLNLQFRFYLFPEKPCQHSSTFQPPNDSLKLGKQSNMKEPAIFNKSHILHSYQPTGRLLQLGLTSPALWLRCRVRCCRCTSALVGLLLWSGSRGSMKVVVRELWSTKNA